MARSRSSTDLLKDLAKNPKIRSGVALAAAATAGAVASARRKSSPANVVPVPVPEPPPTPAGGVAPVEGYCMKERKKVQIMNPTETTMKNGRPAVRGTCPDCGAKIFKIGKLAAGGMGT